MSPECKAIEAALALEGPSALERDPQIALHIETCADCQETLEAQSDLDQLLGQLPTLEPPVATLDRLFDHPELAATAADPADAEPAESHEPTVGPRPWQSRWAYASAAMAALLGLAIGALMLRPSRTELRSPTATDDLVFGIPEAPAAEPKSEEGLRTLAYVGGDAETYRDQDARTDAARQNAAQSHSLEGGLNRIDDSRPKPDPHLVPKPLAKKQPAGKGKAESGIEEQVAEFIVEDEVEIVGDLPVISQSVTASSVLEPTPSSRELQAQLLGVSSRSETKGQLTGSFVDNSGADSPTEIDELKIGADRLAEITELSPGAFVGGRLDEALPQASKEDLQPASQELAAQTFLEGLRRTDGLQFRSATGLWSNSYLPGDPELRLLRARLETWDRSELESEAQGKLALHDAVPAPQQPFDPPRRDAMALFLNADQRQIEGESRVLVQVGLRATDRRRGQRPAMNLGVVLDFAEAPTDEQIDSLQALLFTLDQARQPGDCFHLLTSHGNNMLEPEEFRRGRLRLFLDDLTATDDNDDSRTALRSALERATDRVIRGDDPAAPWGSSSLLLITDRWLAGDADFENLARRNSVAGLALSTIGLGDAEQAEELDELALAGQGRRWWLQDPARAIEIAQREIEAVAQTVARALRLNIRLAAGVQLVGVFDSQPLDTVRAEQVRQAERAIDLRLARNLGIATDRAQDDEGIQIVIPAFQAGDSHTILLDLVVSGPGKVAEVTLRFKDLVRLRNGTVREQLSLRGGRRPPGPLELSVLRSRLRIELGNGLRQAADALLDQGPEAATTRLSELRNLWLGLRQEIPGLAGTGDLETDVAVIDSYLAALSAANVETLDWQLAESLRYAGQLALRPPPPPVKPD